ncbi:MAG: CRTAC1 family protein [Gemmatimonadaceae bacterium]
MRHCLVGASVLSLAVVASCNRSASLDSSPLPGAPLTFERVQPAIFGGPGAQPNAWADYDGDGDLDLFVGFRGASNRLYRNDAGSFVDVGTSAGLVVPFETRAAAWGDYDGDGDPDLFLGFADAPGARTRLYRNDGGRFTDVAPALALDLDGTARQPVWIDYDQDGDVDLFVAFRDRPNRLFRNDGGRFTDVTSATGVGDTRKTVGAVWFDMDQDGDLDLFVANQDGDTDGLYRNDGGHFTDVAPALGIDNPGRRSDIGGVGPAVGDFDNDGDLDLYVASYGPDLLWENLGGGHFRNVAPGTVLAGETHDVTAAWGDVDNDGTLELYVAGFLSAEAEARDHLFKRSTAGWIDVLPTLFADRGASHGVAMADFDRDGALDIALANNHAQGSHFLMRNTMSPSDAARSLAVVALDSAGRWTLPGAEVRLFDAATNRLLGTRLVDSGSSYCAQGMSPLHFGLPRGVRYVNVELTWFSRGSRRTSMVRGIDPATYHGRFLTLRASPR